MEQQHRNHFRTQSHQFGGERVLAQLESKWELSPQFSVADVGFVPRILVLRELGFEPGQNRSNVDAWIRRLLERPSVQGLQGVTTQLLAGI